ncbi:MAG TPA: hypothetical protein VN903_12595 [Polyangia bacterium]|nr:hypothetical protein [Polyangia bacterium]
MQPCGGDLVGTWRFVDGCLNSAYLSSGVIPQCPTWKIDGNIDITGTATFGTELSYSFDVAETLTVSQNFPLSCTTFASCADFGADLQSRETDGTVTCTGTATCDCVTTSSIPLTHSGGTYAASDVHVTLTESTAASPTMDVYCVQGNMLHLMSFSMSNGQIIPLADIVAQRQ